ncbi:peritrophin-1-like [Parasteatoda tepidariorum]|uniref:peritrophin-1-like n=1 Tax=Parasteatoda tepidariorum TaxID=114398 RepID=UPI001C720228|nr:peritrophin-1-like [Parasteatoda tepidariorum]
MISFTITFMQISFASIFLIKFSNASSWSPTCSTSVSGKIPRLIPDPTDCKSMFICSKGKPLQYFCTADMVFNASQQECVHQSGCKSTGKHSDFDECPKKNGRFSVYFPHPTDCTMFYQCDHGMAYPHNCKGGLHFNPKKNVCDWPQNANCKARFITPKL